MNEVIAWAARGADQPLRPTRIELGALGPEQVEIAVEYCGLCHSDLSMLRNEWGMTEYPFVPGHEVVGRVVALGERVRGLELGQRVGLGWAAGSCMSCRSCLSGSQQLCTGLEPTIVRRHGGMAERVRSHWAWAVPLPDALDGASAGPLLCGGITVFKALLASELKPPQRVGVVGIGGLGHMAIQFAFAWGCDVTAFTSTETKRDDASRLGAHRVISSLDSAGAARIAGSIDLLIVTVNVALDWASLLGTLAPKGRMHFVGAVMAPIDLSVFPLLTGQRSVSGSSIGSPAEIALMLEFAVRHSIRPQVEVFPLEDVNQSLVALKNNQLRYRAVLETHAHSFATAG